MIGYFTDSLEMRVLRHVTLKHFCKLLLFLYSLKDWMTYYFATFTLLGRGKIQRTESKGANIC